MNVTALKVKRILNYEWFILMNDKSSEDHFGVPREKTGRALRFYSSPDARIPCAHAIRVRGNRCDPSRKIRPGSQCINRLKFNG